MAEPFSSNPYQSYADLLQRYSFNGVASASFNSITVSGSEQFTNVGVDQWVGTDANHFLESRTLQGTPRQVSISNVGSVYTLSTPQDIDVSSNVVFNRIDALEGSITDLSGSIIEYDVGDITSLSGTDVQYTNATFGNVQSTTGRVNDLSGTTLDYDTATVDTLTVNGNGYINNLNAPSAFIGDLSGALINYIDSTFGDTTISSLTPSRWVGTDTFNKLVSRSLSGTANRVTISNVGEAYTLTCPEDIATTSNVTFWFINIKK